VVFTKKIVASPDAREFDMQILECIDRVLASFGESPRLLLYYLIINECHLSRDQFSAKPAELADCLTKILGATGYEFVEKLTIREIQTTFRIAVEEGSSLKEAIEQARKSFVTC